MDAHKAQGRLQNLSRQIRPKPITSSVIVTPCGSETNSSDPRTLFPVSKSGTEWWGKCRQIMVLDCDMSYYDSDPAGKSKNAVIFLHGNPTSSFLWRNIIPHIEPVARCLAPDLIGQGRSSKRANHSYRFVDHYRYLSEWFDSVNLPEKVTLVIHDWGSALGFHWCHMHPNRVASIVHMESLVRAFPGWPGFPTLRATDVFQNLRSEAGDDLVLNGNFFVESILPLAIMRDLTEDEMNAYRQPFVNPGEDRRPTLTWPREVPIEGDGPEDVIKIAHDYFKWLCESKDIPKLYIDGEPGFFSENLRKLHNVIPNQKTVQVKGLHFLQEDSPDEIGRETKDFLIKNVYIN
ncbi:coelenterazine h 2-monooxygenase-like [Amphiura filiformis]|uniref:coelenterazine h 2-monooxygenase-like n=1 Tax=Amphiura filiformis TaxID=82378 RepID=UPI003B217652